MLFSKKKKGEIFLFTIEQVDASRKIIMIILYLDK